MHDKSRWFRFNLVHGQIANTLTRFPRGYRGLRWDPNGTVDRYGTPAFRDERVLLASSELHRDYHFIESSRKKKKTCQKVGKLPGEMEKSRNDVVTGKSNFEFPARRFRFVMRTALELYRFVSMPPRRDDTFSRKPEGKFLRRDDPRKDRTPRSVINVVVPGTLSPVRAPGIPSVVSRGSRKYRDRQGYASGDNIVKKEVEDREEGWRAPRETFA